MRLIDADLFIQRIESYNTLDEKDKALYNFTLHEIVCMPTVDVLEQIQAEIYETFMTIDGGVHDKSALKCMEIIDKYREE
jgi:hypothetical protein